MISKIERIILVLFLVAAIASSVFLSLPANCETLSFAFSADSRGSSLDDPVSTPVITVLANNQSQSIDVTDNTPLSITAALDPGSLSGQNADWWVAANTAFGPYTLTPSGWFAGISMLAQYPLLKIGPAEVFNGYLPVGDYTFYLAVDMSPDGILNQPVYYDGVQVHVTEFLPLNDPNLQLIYTPNPPNEHKPIIDAINSANVSVRMVMFILTDQDVVNALIAAHMRIPTVQVILDQSNLSDPASSNSEAYQELLDAGVDVMKSSTKFNLTHEKAMVVDDKWAFITAMNMATETDASKNRDFGVITQDASVIAEWNSVFAADVNNSKNQTSDTPPLSVPCLIWSPISSESKLTSLIGSAKYTIITTVETISDQGVIDALSAAVTRNVNVRLITPQCNKGSEPLFNYPALNTLSSNGVSVRLMPYPSSTSTPYMHSKMILVDNTVAYVGSVNFSSNSIDNNRETGIIFTNGAATQTISSLFESDWSKTIELPATPPTICPTDN